MDRMAFLGTIWREVNIAAFHADHPAPGPFDMAATAAMAGYREVKN